MTISLSRLSKRTELKKVEPQRFLFKILLKDLPRSEIHVPFVAYLRQKQIPFASVQGKPKEYSKLATELRITEEELHLIGVLPAKKLLF